MFKIEKYGSKTVERILDLYIKQIKSMTEISPIVKLNRATIAKILKYHNVKIRPRNMETAINDYTGLKFNKLTIEEIYSSVDKKVGRIAKCKCDCGNYSEITLARVVNKRQKSCGCLSTEGGKLKGYYQAIRGGAKDRNIDFLVTEDELYNLLEKQQFKCKLTNVNLYLPKGHHDKGVASLDRINSDKCYTIDNLQWVHKEVNIMKMYLEQEKFLQWCELVVKNKANTVACTSNINTLEWL